MKHTVKPEIVEGCECEDCKAGKHIYSLYRWTEEGWDWVAISLRSYTSAEECKRLHWWGIEFGHVAIWEDGTPIVEPQPRQELRGNGGQSGTGRMVLLNTEALRKSADRLERHWRARRD